jgi:hypothetical protein
MRMSRFITIVSFILLVSPIKLAVAQQPATPNIVVIFGDDIGQTNVSAY